MEKRSLSRSLLLSVGGLLFLALFLLPSARVSAASSQGQIPAGGFADTCNVQVSSNGMLSGTCRAANGTFQNTSIDLNNHVGNINGGLTPNSSGFVRTCSNIMGRNTGAFRAGLQADCLDRNHQFHTSAIDLNNFITNQNGRLVWG